MTIGIFNRGKVSIFLRWYSVRIIRKHAQRNTSNVDQRMHTRVQVS